MIQFYNEFRPRASEFLIDQFRCYLRQLTGPAFLKGWLSGSLVTAEGSFTGRLLQLPIRLQTNGRDRRTEIRF